jgi:hypothetical protein
MGDAAFQMAGLDKYEVATEVLSSAARILRAVGFDQQEIPRLFAQVVARGVRTPIWIEPLQATERR